MNRVEGFFPSPMPDCVSINLSSQKVEIDGRKMRGGGNDPVQWNRGEA